MSIELAAREIAVKNIEVLKDIYQGKSHEHSGTFSIFSALLSRFRKFPELQNCLKLYVLSDDWKRDGAFVAIFQTLEAESYVFFDTLDHSLNETLKNCIALLDFSTTIKMYDIRRIFLPIVYDVINSQNLSAIERADLICYMLPKMEALNLKITLPTNFTIDSLSQDNVSQVNSAWSHKSEGSEKYISHVIKNNTSIGLFDEMNRLVAWCLRHDSGALGVLQVDSNHLRKGYGSIVAKAISKKIAEEDDCDINATIVSENVKSVEMFKKTGFKEEWQTWLLVIKNQGKS
ncbi:CLUMA_CG001876, isoform A [Clunio marinus]|uniref:CLUMA_CG001876, isoform A n=1 Tax=Clunio marinus TaxID=568069 RepID=A0A1J1HJK4_9DIPT|nr:CLUMA_CG001876, isoform A [Clunio marinus]